jgi:hypothetical protein
MRFLEIKRVACATARRYVSVRRLTGRSPDLAAFAALGAFPANAATASVSVALRDMEHSSSYTASSRVCLKAVAEPVLLLVVANEVEALRGQFVVEVGVRQAWPFLTLCDNAPTPPRETRLYIGTTFRVGSSPQTFADGDTEPAVAQLLELNNRTVTDVAVGANNELRLVFDRDQSTLTVDAVPRDFTGEIWWLGAMRP